MAPNITSSFDVRANGRFEGLVTGLVEGDNLLRVRPGERRRTVDHDQEPPDRRAGVLGAGGGAVALPHPEPDEPHARAVDRCEVQRADEGRAVLPQPLERLRGLRPGEPAGTRARPADDDRPAKDRPVHRGARHRDGQPRYLPVRAARRSDEGGLTLDRAAVEPQVRQLVRRGLQCQLFSSRPSTNQVVAGNADLLGRGFAVGTSSLNTYANQCNDIISAEALMMTKEILTERHGPIRYTIGSGGSAGTMQQHLITEAYPGLLNGIATSLLLRGPLVPGARVVRLHPALALLRATERGAPLCRGLPARSSRSPQPAVLDGGRPSEGVGIQPSGAGQPCAGRRSASRSPSSSPITRSGAPAPPNRRSGAGMP